MKGATTAASAFRCDLQQRETKALSTFSLSLCICCCSLNILSPFMQPKKHPACLPWPLFHQSFICAASRRSHLRRSPPAAAWASCSGGTRGKLSRPDRHPPQTSGLTFSSCVLACWQHLFLPLFIMTRPAMWCLASHWPYQSCKSKNGCSWWLYVDASPFVHCNKSFMSCDACSASIQSNTFNE